jgi:hypothetical protein
MLQLLLVSGDVDFTPPGTFAAPRILIYIQAMVNILAQPLLVCSIHAVNILTTCFNKVPTDLAKRLSPLTTHNPSSTSQRILPLHSFLPTSSALLSTC